MNLPVHVIPAPEGAKSGGGGSYTPNIQKDTVASKATLSILYGLSEGEVQGFGKTWAMSDLKKRVFLDGTPIMAADGTTLLDVEVDFRSGTLDQTAITGMPSVTVETTINTEVRDSAPVSRSFNRPEVKSYDVRISIPALYTSYTNGDSLARTLVFAIDVALADGNFTNAKVITVNEKITNGLERTYNVEVESSSVRYIRVRRITQEANSQLIADKLILAAITEVLDVQLTYPHTALLWLKFDAEAFSSVPKMTVLLDGKSDIKVPANYDPITRQYATTGTGTTNGLWNGEFKLAYTDNPVWHWLDIVTSKRYGLGNRISMDNIDIYYLYNMSKYCDELVPDGAGGYEPRFTSNNLYLQSAEDAYTVLMDIASIFRGKTFWDGNYLKPKVDVPRDPIFLFTRANAMNISYSCTADSARHNLISAQYYDTTNQYKARYAYARDTDDIKERGRIVDTDLSAVGCTSEGQAQRAANYAQATELLETELVSFQTGADGFLPKMGDVFLLADEMVGGQRMGGRVVEYIRNPVTSTAQRAGSDIDFAGDPFSFAGDGDTRAQGAIVVLDREIADSYIGGTIYFNKDGTILVERTIVAIDKLTVTLNESLDDYDIVGLVWVVSSSTLAPLAFYINNLSFDKEKMQWSISGVQYNAHKYTATDLSAVTNDAPVTIIDPIMPQAPATISANYHVVIDQGININTIDVGWAQAVKGVRYAIEMSRDGSAFNLLAITADLTYTIRNAYNGAYVFRVRAYDVLGNVSAYIVSNAVQVVGKDTAPPLLAEFSMQGILFGMRFYWVFPAGVDDTRAVRLMFTFSDPATTVNPTWTTQDIAYPSREYVLNGMSANVQVWAKAAIVDVYGIAGEYSPIATATTSADANAILDILNDQITALQLSQDLRDQIGDITSNQAFIDLTQAVDGLYAEYYLRIQSGKYISGYGLGTNGVRSDFIIHADTFAIAPPTDLSDPDAQPAYAFIYQSTDQEMPNGTVIPKGLYLDQAFIGQLDASRIWVDQLSAISSSLGTLQADSGNIKDLAVTTGKIANLAVDTLRIADRAVTFPLFVSLYPAYSNNGGTGFDVQFPIGNMAGFTIGSTVQIFISSSIKATISTGSSHTPSIPASAYQLKMYVDDFFIASMQGLPYISGYNSDNSGDPPNPSYYFSEDIIGNFVAFMGTYTIPANVPATSKVRFKITGLYDDTAITGIVGTISQVNVQILEFKK